MFERCCFNCKHLDYDADNHSKVFCKRNHFKKEQLNYDDIDNHNDCKNYDIRIDDSPYD